MNWTDRPTHAPMHRPTDHPQESLTAIGRCATRATWPNNNNNNNNNNDDDDDDDDICVCRCKVGEFE